MRIYQVIDANLQETWQHTVDINQLAKVCARWIENQKAQIQQQTATVVELAKKAGIFASLRNDIKKWILQDQFYRSPLTITVDFASPEGATYGYYDKSNHNIRVFYKTAKSFGLPEAIAHELTHALDLIKSQGKAFKSGSYEDKPDSSMWTADDWKNYTGNPMEINARFAQVLMFISDDVIENLHNDPNWSLSREELVNWITRLFEFYKIDRSWFAEGPKGQKSYNRLLSRTMQFYQQLDKVARQDAVQKPGLLKKISTAVGAQVAKLISTFGLGKKGELDEDFSQERTVQENASCRIKSNESFDRDEFLRHMAKLRAREHLRKTDPVKALVQDLKDKENQPQPKATSDDSDLGNPHINPLDPLNNDPFYEDSVRCPHCGGPFVSEKELQEKQDACYYKVKSRYKVWPSAYASGALVQCRKKGAKNWGNKGKSK